LLKIWRNTGRRPLERLRLEKPDAKVVASLLPEDVNLNVRQFDDLTDEQLLARLQQVTALAKPLLAAIDESESRY